MSEKTVKIEGYEALTQHWPFILSSLPALNETAKDKHVSTENFFRLHVDVAVGAKYGAIFVLTSKNDKPLAFITAYDNSSAYSNEHTLWVYCIYSNDKKDGATKMVFSALEDWARLQGFTEIQSQSARTSGASIRWCRKTFGLQLSKLVFRKTL